MPALPTPPTRRARRLRFLLAATIGAAALGACGDYGMDHGYRADRVPPARVTGPSVSCIPLAAISESPVRDGRTIDFLSGSHRGWRNQLPANCPGLASERAFSYATSLSQLCSTDIIHVLEQIGGRPTPGASCGLGQFTPIDLK